ncbi:ankyrin repeat domain-containing protein [Anaeramoeba ignava]|uniref:Ankyrin repeat domain-containing protein n=1 Tax=Anaeramoeba ignava TaxID=1746090 RepID=A0A9Q0RGS9_ANAIG|nr:ankyrin repeat domain-containing protein [Anaeramoeba ignava]
MEEISKNPFFIDLKKKFSTLYEKASGNQWLVCVPSKSSFTKSQINQEFAEMHVLKPSISFKDVFDTNTNPPKSIQIDGTTIKTREGFSKKRNISIITKEIFFNENFQPFNAVLIETPLVEPVEKEVKEKPQKELRQKPVVEKQRQQTQTNQKKKPKEKIQIVPEPEFNIYNTQEVISLSGEIITVSSIFPPHKTLEEISKFLTKFHENFQVFPKIKEKLKEFKQSYFFVKKYEEDAANRIEKLCEDTFSIFINVNPKFSVLANQKYNKIELLSIMKMYVLGTLNIYKKMRELYSEEDDNCYQQIKKEYQKNLLILISNLQLKFFQNIFQRKTPFEMMLVLDATIQKLTKLAYPGKESKSKLLSTDDLLPLLIYTITLSQPTQLYSRMIYCSSFNLTNISTSKFGFIDASFQTSVLTIHEGNACSKYEIEQRERREVERKEQIRLKQEKKKEEEKKERLSQIKRTNQSPRVIDLNKKQGEVKVGGFLSNLLSRDDFLK